VLKEEEIGCQVPSMTTDVTLYGLPQQRSISLTLFLPDREQQQIFAKTGRNGHTILLCIIRHTMLLTIPFPMYYKE
jgi:hypothetical protein